MAVPRDLCRTCACSFICCSRGCRPASSRPKTRATCGSSTGFPPGATMTRTTQVQREVEQYFLTGRDKENIGTFFSVAGGGQGASGQNIGPGFREPRRLRPSGKDRRTARRAIVERATGRFPRTSRRAGVCVGAGRDPRSRPDDRLHDGAAEHQRDEPRSNSRISATACLLRRNADPLLSAGPPVRAARRRQPEGQHGRAAACGARTRRPRTSTRPFRPPGAAATSTTSSIADASSASMCRAMRRTGPNPSDIGQWFVRNNQGRHGAFLVLRHHQLDDCADDPGPVRRLSGL